MKTLTDSIQLRAARISAYRKGDYTFSVPPVYTGNWNEESWCNFVKFTDPDLTGFLPYDRTKQAHAAIDAQTVS